jgi:hypothetical protein
MVIRQGTRMCDGKHESWIAEFDKKCGTNPIGALDACVKTESLAQMFILSALISPPTARYQKVGTETIGGISYEIYEQRTVGDESTEVTKVWFNPASGYPVRMLETEVQPDGTSRPTREYEEISADVPLSDEVFNFAQPEGYTPTESKADVQADTKLLDMHWVAAGYGGDTKLEAWHALRVADNAAVILWRRSAPVGTAEGSPNWLSDMTIKLSNADDPREVRHVWLYESQSPDHWNWSLVAVSEGQLSDRDSINIELTSEKSSHTVGFSPLRFPDPLLDQIIAAAGRETLPEGGPKLSLDSIRAQAPPLSPGN